MTNPRRAARRLLAGLTGLTALLLLGACSGGSGGALGNVLGAVLGGGQGGQGGQVAGTVQGVNTQSQQIGLQTSDGQQVALLYDNNTKVVYQNQLYAVTNLERGDQVVARIQQTNDGGYYTDSLHVTQSVSTSGGTAGGGSTAGGNVQTLQGTVRQIDRANGLFELQVSNGATVIVSLPYNVTRSDQTRFQNLRTGETVRLYGVFLNNSRVELRQFY